MRLEGWEHVKLFSKLQMTEKKLERWNEKVLEMLPGKRMNLFEKSRALMITKVLWTSEWKI